MQQARELWTSGISRPSRLNIGRFSDCCLIHFLVQAVVRTRVPVHVRNAGNPNRLCHLESQNLTARDHLIPPRQRHSGRCAMNHRTVQGALGETVESTGLRDRPSRDLHFGDQEGREIRGHRGI
jgi:hypothetical protein